MGTAMSAASSRRRTVGRKRLLMDVRKGREGLPVAGGVVVMETGRVPPGRELPAAVEVLHDTQRTRVTRLSFGGHAVVLKEPLGPDAQRRLRHEFAMLKRLRGIPGIAQLLEEPRYPWSISLADAGVTNLAAVTTPLEGAVLIRL